MLPQGWIPLGWASDGMAANFNIGDAFPMIPQLLLAVTGFALGYLGARTGPATARVSSSHA